MKFLIAIEPGTATTAYGVVVPDLPGCFSAGDTLEEAFDNAREAIELHCQTLAEDGGELPVARPMAEQQADPEFAGWIWAMVGAPSEAHPVATCAAALMPATPVAKRPTRVSNGNSGSAMARVMSRGSAS